MLHKFFFSFQLKKKLLGATGKGLYLLIRTKLKVCPVSEVTRSRIRVSTGIHGLG